jgi:hypothetical protein
MPKPDPIHCLTTRQLEQIIVYFHDVKLEKINKRSIEGLLKILKSKTQ